MTGVLVLLLVFYAGAVLASARCWFAVWRGKVPFSALRDVTGVGNPAALRRCFGLTGSDGYYRVTLVEVIRHRRSAGVILTNLPVHLMFLLSLAWAWMNPGAPASAAITWAASSHAAVLAAVAASVFIRGRRALID